MRRLSLLLVILSTALGVVACSGASGQPQTGGGDETCPAVSPGVCPPGCEWNGTECRKKGGIIIYDRKGSNDVDAGDDAAAQ